MARRFLVAKMALMLLAAGVACPAQRSYVGFDRNDYPGDAALTAMRANFRYVGYWLNNPPGVNQISWAGKRALLKQSGFGFLLLFNGRNYAELKSKDAAALGSADGNAAVAAAAREGFPKNVIIFLDQEEGGRMLPEQAAYLFAWADAVRAGGARAGVYCSGIDVAEGSGTINTAQNIVELEKAREQGHSKSEGTEHRLKIWIANDQCPPSPGCTLAAPRLSAAVTPDLAGSVVVWQYAQSPRRSQFTRGCPANYNTDGNCYAPGLAHDANAIIDLNTADSPDPSEGR